MLQLRDVVTRSSGKDQERIGCPPPAHRRAEALGSPTPPQGGSDGWLSAE